MIKRQLKDSPLLAGSAVYLFSNILGAAIPFSLLPVLTRFLTPAEYGKIAMFQTLIGALTAFVGLSVQAAAARKFYESDLGDKDLSEFIGSCFQILLVTTLAALIIMALLGDQLAPILGFGYQWALVAVVVTASTKIIQMRLVQWQVRKKPLRYGLVYISQNLMDVLLSLLLVVAFLQGFDGRITAQVWSTVIFAGFSVWLLARDRLIVFFVWRPDLMRDALSFGFWLIPHILGVFLLASIDRFVISHYLGLDKAGIFMVAAQVGSGVYLVFDAVNKAYVPWLYERLKRGDENDKTRIVFFTYIWCLVLLFGAFLAFIFGPEMVVFVFGADFSEAGKLVGWIVLGQVFSGMYLMVTNYIFFSKRTGVLSMMTILSGLINVALLLVFVNFFGLIGGAYSFCLSMGVRFLLTWWVSNKTYPMPWFGFIS